jgi:hypothetical protein
VEFSTFAQYSAKLVDGIGQCPMAKYIGKMPNAQCGGQGGNVKQVARGQHETTPF